MLKYTFPGRLVASPDFPAGSTTVSGLLQPTLVPKGFPPYIGGMMKKILTLALGLQLLGNIALAQTWLPYQSKEGKFSIQLPTEPRITADTSEQTITNMFISQTADEIFLVGFTSYDPGSDADSQSELLDARDGFAGAMQVEVVETKNLNYKGYPGIQFIATKENTYVVSRVYLIQKKLYQLVSVTSNGEKSQYLDKFFSSFTVSR